MSLTFIRAYEQRGSIVDCVSCTEGGGIQWKAAYSCGFVAFPSFAAFSMSSFVLEMSLTAGLEGRTEGNMLLQYPLSMSELRHRGHVRPMLNFGEFRARTFTGENRQNPYCRRLSSVSTDGVRVRYTRVSVVC